MPKNWNHNLWITETTVAGTIYGQKSRSTLLQAVDQALTAYVQAAPLNKLGRLNDLRDAYDLWVNSKNDATTSIRNKAGTLLKDFTDWMELQEALFLPYVEANWAGIPNCYAYAMKCRPVSGQPPIPGFAAGIKILPYDPVWNQPDLKINYHKKLLEGIQADADACDKEVTILSEPEGDKYPSPVNLPTEEADGTHYIAAMIANKSGFHFMRRDSVNGHWSHKNGAAEATVETTVRLPSHGAHATVRHRGINDEIAVEMLRCDAGGMADFRGWKFVSYILVPHDGITVKGP